MMLASDDRGRDLGITAFAQMLGAKTVDGFVPNGANAAEKSRDRTEPIVGAKVLRAVVERFGIEQTAWVVEWSFDQLYGWHDWAWRNRRLAPAMLIAPGSQPLAVPDPSDWGANTMQGARWETGMDNSPMCV
jgi:putative isomerase